MESMERVQEITVHDLVQLLRNIADALAKRDANVDEIRHRLQMFLENLEIIDPIVCTLRKDYKADGGRVPVFPC
jgi:hypothetical protein